MPADGSKGLVVAESLQHLLRVVKHHLRDPYPMPVQRDQGVQALVCLQVCEGVSPDLSRLLRVRLYLSSFLIMHKNTVQRELSCFFFAKTYVV